MKRLMMVIAASVIGFTANAASYQWACSSSFFDGTGGTGKMADGTSVYLMFESVYSQTALVADFAGAGVDTSKTLGSLDISGGKIGAGTATYGTTDNQTAYLAVIIGDRLFISSTAAADYTLVGTSSITFSSQAYLTRYNNTEKTLLPDTQASAGYTGAGWYAVPEPTSGLLMLVGLAGLALRRRRA